MTKRQTARNSVSSCFARWWAKAALWVAIVVIAFSAAGCAPAGFVVSTAMGTFQIPKERVRFVCWDPPEKGTGDEYFVFAGNRDEAVSESRAGFLTELRKGALIFKYRSGWVKTHPST